MTKEGTRACVEKRCRLSLDQMWHTSGHAPGLQDRTVKTHKVWSKLKPEMPSCLEVTGHPWLQWDHWGASLRTWDLDGNSTQQLPGHGSLLTVYCPLS